ncbi:hypothetical protein [Hoeflea sp.]|uniref:hypothetical protein n=1 Tax=Hoeflea sp. TaxID=1940281 RepID=UPI00374A8B1D
MIENDPIIPPHVEKAVAGKSTIIVKPSEIIPDARLLVQPRESICQGLGYFNLAKQEMHGVCLFMPGAIQAIGVATSNWFRYQLCQTFSWHFHALETANQLFMTMEHPIESGLTTWPANSVDL